MIKKAKIDGKMVDVVELTEINRSPASYPKNFTAIEKGDFILPIRGKTDTRPGIYINGPIGFIIEPTEEDAHEYSKESVIDFEDANSIKDIIERQNEFRNLERVVLTTVDNIFIPNLCPNDSPEMIGLKESVIAKQIDLTKYEQRFGSNFNNDRRLFDNNNITMVKLKSICKALDIKATLILEDVSPDVPNPMNKRIEIDLMDRGDV